MLSPQTFFMFRAWLHKAIVGLLCVGVATPAQGDFRSKVHEYLNNALNRLDELAPEFAEDLFEIPDTRFFPIKPRYSIHAPPGPSHEFRDTVLNATRRSSRWFYGLAPLPGLTFGSMIVESPSPEAQAVLVGTFSAYLFVSLGLIHGIRKTVLWFGKSEAQQRLEELPSVHHLERVEEVLKELGPFSNAYRNGAIYLTELEAFLGKEIEQRMSEFNQNLYRFTWYLDPASDERTWTDLLESYSRVWIAAALAHHEYQLHNSAMLDRTEPFSQTSMLCHAMLGRMGKSRPSDQDGGIKATAGPNTF